MSAVNELVITPEFVTNIIAVDLADETTFTTADKAKLNGIEAGAQVNTVTRVAGKTGAVELNAGDIAYDASETYASGKIGAALKSAQEKLDTINAGDIGYDGSATYDTGTVGKELTHLNRQINDIDSKVKELGGYTIEYSYTLIKNEYVTTTGQFESYNTWDRTDYIELQGQTLTVSITRSGNPYNCFYDENKTFISNFQTVTASSVTVEIPTNAKYVVLSAGAGETWVLFSEVSGLINRNTWKGKKWVSYGDSITQGNMWQPFVAEKIGLVHINAGLGGSSVADGQINGVASMCNSERILNLPSDADIITVMGGTNDYNLTNNGDGTPLGSFPTASGPYDTFTFYGAYLATVQRLQARCPNAIIIIMSCINSRGTAGENADYCYINNVGLTTPDYAKAAEEVARYTGCAFIDMEKCGINLYNRTRYISDAVHPNSLGGELMSRMLIGYLQTHLPY